MSIASLSDFKKYLRAFNAHDYDIQHAFYDERITLKLPATPILKGKSAILDYYSNAVHNKFDEAVIPSEILINDLRIIVPKRTIFGAREDVDFIGHRLKKGDVVLFSAYLDYQLTKEGKIIHINLTGFEEEEGKPAMQFLGGAKSFKQVVHDSLEKASDDFGVWDWESMKGIAWVEAQ